jgi:hypothetical protein
MTHFVHALDGVRYSSVLYPGHRDQCYEPNIELQIRLGKVSTSVFEVLHTDGNAEDRLRAWKDHIDHLQREKRSRMMVAEGDDDTAAKRARGK